MAYPVGSYLDALSSDPDRIHKAPSTAEGAAIIATEEPPEPCSTFPVGQRRVKHALPGFTLVEGNGSGRPIRERDRDIQPRQRPQRLGVMAGIVLLCAHTAQE